MDELFDGNADSADNEDVVLTRGESVTTVPGTEVVVLEDTEEDVEESACEVEVTPVTVGLGEGVTAGEVAVDVVTAVGVSA